MKLLKINYKICHEILLFVNPKNSLLEKDQLKNASFLKIPDHNYINNVVQKGELGLTSIIKSFIIYMYYLNSCVKYELKKFSLPLMLKSAL